MMNLVTCLPPWNLAKKGRWPMRAYSNWCNGSQVNAAFASTFSPLQTARNFWRRSSIIFVLSMKKLLIEREKPLVNTRLLLNLIMQFYWIIQNCFQNEYGKQQFLLTLQLLNSCCCLRILVRDSHMSKNFVHWQTYTTNSNCINL